jgi:hypothetical protein
MTTEGLITLLLKCYSDPFATDHDPRSLLKIAAGALGEGQFHIRELEDALAEQKAQVASLRARVGELESSLAR